MATQNDASSVAKKGRDPLQHTSMYERNLDDSEESDGEGGLGNVNRMVMRPPGHSGKAKKGHLCFDASFETGNLGRVDLISEYEYDLFIRPDTCCPKLRMWFNFVVDNVKQDQRVIFNIVNFGKSRNLYNTEMTPIVKSTSRPKWQRLLRCHVFYHRSIYHRFRHILSFAFAFDREDDVYHFALATPYSYSREQAYLDAWMKKVKNVKETVEREVIGKSIQKRKIDLITIDNKPAEEEGENKKKEKRRVVVVISRIHGGEPPASFVCQGLMDFLISSHYMAQLLRKNVTFKIIPMLNPDGVHLGNQRSNLMGLDLNRTWNAISPWAHPTIKVALEAIQKTEASKEHKIDFIIDIHAHTSLKGCFIYGNSYEDVYRFERHVVFPKIFANKAEGYCMDNVLYNSDSSKAGTTRRFFCTGLTNTNANSFTLMVSLGGYHLPNSKQYFHYNDEAYLRLGRNLGRSLYEYYKQINFIEVPIRNTDKKKGHKGRRKKENKFKHHNRKQKPSPSPRQQQQYLEPRIFSPCITKPDANAETEQNQIYEYPAIQTKFQSKRFNNIYKQLCRDENQAGDKQAGRAESPIPSLSIIDLNNTIRTDLKQSNQMQRVKKNLSKLHEWNTRKKEYLIQLAHMRSSYMSSDDEDTD